MDEIQKLKFQVKKYKEKVECLQDKLQEREEKLLFNNKLLKNEELYKNLFENNAMGVAISDLEGHLKKINKKMAEISGIHDIHDLQDQNVKNYYVDLDDFIILLKEFQENGKLENYEVKLKRINGNEYWALLSIQKINYEGTPHFLSTQLDITEKKRAEQELKISEEKFSKAFLISPISLGIAERDSQKLFDVNQAMVETLGYSKEELIGKTIYELNIFRDDYWNKIISKMEKDGNVRNFPYKFNRKNGDIGEGLFSLEHLKIGNMDCTLGQMVDITELESAKRELEKNNNKIEEEKLRSQKIESLALLAGGIAHDFNNILAGILGNVNLMQLDEDITPKYKKMLSNVEKATHRAAKLTNQILTFSKGGTPIKKPVNIVELIKDSAYFASRGTNVKIKYNFQDNLPLANIDAGQINQVINNLLINGIQAMPEGGRITINAEVVDYSRVQDPTLKPGNYLKLSIIDYGVGIPKEIEHHIFTPYFTTKEKGNGLGLATSYSIVSNHGGKISFTSEKGKGTTFFVYLPISRDSIGSLNKHNIKKIFRKFEGNVLLMDDDHGVQITMKRMLEHFGFNVKITENGQDTIKKFKKDCKKGITYDLIILDLIIPDGLGGEKTAKIIKEIKPEQLLLASTGYAKSSILNNYQKFGFKDILKKPFTIKQLQEKLSEIF